MSDVDPGDAVFAARWPVADLTPSDFEAFVAELLATPPNGVADYRVTAPDRIEGTDGTFVFDATVRYRLAGLDFLTVVEAKHHSNPIKREVVQVVHSKALSVGAQKAVVVATAHFQQGAIDFASTHGVALVYVTEGRFTFIRRGAGASAPLSRAEALESLGVAPFVGVLVARGHASGTTSLAVVEPGDHERLGQVVLAPE